MSSKVLLTVLTKCFLYEGYEKLSLKRRSLEEEKLKKINLEARKYFDKNFRPSWQRSKSFI